MAAPRTHALVVAAGTGTRAGGALPKQYRRLGGLSVVGHALERLSRHQRIDGVTVVIGQGQEALFAEATVELGPFPTVTGGAIRQQSVRNGLAAINTERVLIHDAARPFVPAAVIDRLLAALDGADAAVPVLPVVDTVAEADGTLGEVVPRDRLRRVQTPQAFRTAAIRDAHARWAGDAASDDAQVARAAGYRVATVAGDRRLEKLTHAEDFAGWARRLPDVRTGNGYDVHRFAAGDHVWLCGVRVPHEGGLAGHSDADVGLHALTDAILGAIGAGDIGEHFPPSDPQWKGASSDRFLAHACDLAAARGGRVGHADVTLICEAPRIGPHKAAMRARVAEILRLTEDRVSVKATTTEGLGFAGRREGIAAQATATVVMEPALD